MLQLTRKTHPNVSVTQRIKTFAQHSLLCERRLALGSQIDKEAKVWIESDIERLAVWHEVLVIAAKDGTFDSRDLTIRRHIKASKISNTLRSLVKKNVMTKEGRTTYKVIV